jgi:hypothetical protein
VPPDSQLQPKVLPARRGEPAVNQLFALHRCNLSDKFTFARTQFDSPLGLGPSQEVSLLWIAHPGTPIPVGAQHPIRSNSRLAQRASVRTEVPVMFTASGHGTRVSGGVPIGRSKT